MYLIKYKKQNLVNRGLFYDIHHQVKLIIILGNTIPPTSMCLTKIIIMLPFDLKVKTLTTIIIV